MAEVGAARAIEPDDPGYPDTSAPDPVYPCQTLEPIGPPLDGIATPFMWSRLSRPLSRALVALWQTLGLLRRARPAGLVSIHFGRIALNAHAWERLQALWNGVEPDASLIPPAGAGIAALPERFERLRVGLRRSRLRVRVERAEDRADDLLLRARSADPRELDPAELARGPLDDPAWTEALLPWMFARLVGEKSDPAIERVRVAILLEQRFGTELGRRLVGRGLLGSPVDAAYLTLDERLAAVHEPSSVWRGRAAARAARIQQYVDLEVPSRFWGRPRAAVEKVPS
jgi:hypothetical protein